MTLRIPLRADVAVSVLAHVVLVGAVLLLAEVHPFAEVPEQRIEVEVVTADEAPPVPEAQPEPKPVEQPTPNFEVSQTPAEEPKPQQQAPAAQQQPAETKPPPPAPQQPPQSAQAQTPPPQQAQPAPQPQPAPQAAAAFPPAIPQEPDITVKYSVALGLPAEGGGFDAPAETVANISAEAVAALRKRLRACAALPAGLSPSDNVKIVIRVGLTPDGRLAQEPFLIEASASAKGPALMKGAIAALEACQPYTMLPADKYREWRVLDIGFTPQDFRG
ncbi:hypothetical protein BJ123_11862 [Rhodopseudomonas thermotolerans]|uniref:Cell division and transport-associated protein TolA n=2 Tax=Rhodopseudomonas TaxID=1073 RepID=A0A336JVQ3_9BRAD|nr:MULTISPECIES: hypothetical protein [Rhodopseudomonas]RED29703.1 hypothetical protein BJ125_11862 [Rhodopseudomonas pentothenatexigens]REF92464.1 hypothetical protein BJ123_11862 [Rhodopseudomonas thermotolerans]SSW92309.1 hypothetical protein SAMN05892882_11862 [Rhodopseudomonas pentothenatexigens]